MQPLQAAPEISRAERRRKNQQIVSKGTRQKAKVLSSGLSVNEEEPPLLMMSSMSGDADSVVGGEFSSPSKRLLQEEGRKHFKIVGGRAKRQSKNKAPSSKVGMSSKITRALFRQRSSSHGTFSKMVSYLCKRCELNRSEPLSSFES